MKILRSALCFLFLGMLAANAGTLSFFNQQGEFAGWLRSQSSAGVVDFKSVLLADTPNHLWLFNDASGQITDYAGSDNLTIPSGLTLGQPGLLVGNAATCANVNSANLTMGASTVNDFAYNAPWSYEFVVRGTNAETGSETQYVLASKDTSPVFNGYIIELIYNHSAATRDSTTVPTTWMLARFYIQDTLGNACDASGTINITNGGLYDIVFTYQYTNSAPFPRFWVNGNPIQMTYALTGNLSDLNNHTVVGTVLNYNNSLWYSGNIQCCASYNYMLSDQQIVTHYLASQNLNFTPSTTLYTHYRGNDDRGLLIQNDTFHALWVASSNLWYVYGMDLYGQNVQIGSDYDMNGRTNISIYSTPSLAQNTYKFVTNALPFAIPNTFAVESPNVLYNAANNYYVMWFRRYDSGTFTSWYGVATSSVPTFADCKIISTNTIPAGASTAGDASLFEDSGGSAYMIYSDNLSLFDVPLGSGYTNTSGASTTIIGSAGLEGPFLFKKGSTYFSGGSTAEYFNELGMKQVVYCASTAGNPLSGWGATNTVFLGPDAYSSGFDFQSRGVLQSVNSPNRFFLTGDYWANGFLQNSAPTFFELMFPTTTSLAVSNLLKEAPLP